MNRAIAPLVATILTTALTIGLPRALAARPAHAPVDATSTPSTPYADYTANPLRPADTSSPRATLTSFLNALSRSHRVLMEATRKDEATPGIFASRSVKRMEKEAEGLFARGVYCLNLSEIPPSFRHEAGYANALLLKEILDRIDLPPDSQIPDADALVKEAGENGVAALDHWRIPNTDIVIARVESGPREGEYLFTPRTVSRLNEFYTAVKDQPYRSGPLVTKGFLDFYLIAPGSLVPPKWERRLPAWSRHVFLSWSIWQWGATIALLLAWVLLLRTIFRAMFMRRVVTSPSAHYWKRAAFCLVVILTLLGVHTVLRQYLNMSGHAAVYLRVVLQPVWWAFAAAMSFFAARAVAEMINASRRIDPKGAQASYFRALFTVLGFISAGTLFIIGLSRQGISLVPLLTGVGIGGLAIALAARPTLESLISSFTIFADDPYKPGERVKVMEHDGTVESIGLRSTRIRLLNGHVTSIPNDKMAAAEIENIGRRPYIRRLFDITITYDTPPEKIRRAVAILKEILSVPPPGDGEGAGAPHPNQAINQPDFPPRVFFNEFNAASLNLMVIYWYHPPDWWAYHEHAHGINTQIVERFNAEGIEFAFPTQTLHLAGDENRPLKIDRPVV